MAGCNERSFAATPLFLPSMTETPSLPMLTSFSKNSCHGTLTFSTDLLIADRIPSASPLSTNAGLRKKT
jgi:hypothetical protein